MLSSSGTSSVLSSSGISSAPEEQRRAEELRSLRKGSKVSTEGQQGLELEEGQQVLDAYGGMLMVLHLPHAEGAFGVIFNDITNDDALCASTSRFVVWLGTFPQDRQVTGGCDSSWCADSRRFATQSTCGSPL